MEQLALDLGAKDADLLFADKMLREFSAIRKPPHRGIVSTTRKGNVLVATVTLFDGSRTRVAFWHYNPARPDAWSQHWPDLRCGMRCDRGTWEWDLERPWNAAA
jgi:hypothetical protein